MPRDFALGVSGRVPMVAANPAWTSKLIEAMKTTRRVILGLFAVTSISLSPDFTST
jgi:hypothetical protein